MSSKYIKEITDAKEFDKEINKKGIVIVDMWAEWCGPCRMFSKIYDTFAKDNKDVVCLKVNVDQNRDISQRYNVMSIPTVLFFKDGKLVKQQVGVMPLEILKQMVESLKE